MSILLNRKSIRKYDENHKISRKELLEILNYANRAPSSQNLQPTRLVIIESQEAKDKIRSALYGNQVQLDTSSAFIVLFTDLNKFDKAESIFTKSEKLGLMPTEVKLRQLEMISKQKESVSKETTLTKGLIDAGLYGMQLMLAAKEFGYDTCPIGGFNKSIVNELLDIPTSLVPVLMISLGKADEEGYNSVRLDLEEITTFL